MLKISQALLLVAALLLNLAPAANPQDRLRRPRREFYGYEPSLVAATAFLPNGTVFNLRLETPLDSKTAHIGDRFKTRVIAPITDPAGRPIVPVDSMVEGYIETLHRAKLRRRSAIIGVRFDRLILPSQPPGYQNVPLEGELAGAEGKNQKIDEDSQLKSGKSNFKRNFVFIGGGAGAGAVVGALTSGALLGAGVGAGVGLAAVLLSKGKEVYVERGTRISMQLVRPLDAQWALPVPPPGSLAGGGRGDTGAPGGSGGSAGGGNRPRDPDPGGGSRPGNPGSGGGRPRNPQPGGSSGGQDAGAGLRLVNVSSALAERSSDGMLRVSITAEVPSSGWKLSTDHEVSRDTAEVVVRGRPGEGMVAQVVSHPTVMVVIPDPDRLIRRVQVQGANGVRSVVPLARSPGRPVNNAPALNTKIADRLSRLFEDYSDWVGARRLNSGVYEFRSDVSANTPEAQIFFALRNAVEESRRLRDVVLSEERRQSIKRLASSADSVDRLWRRARISVTLDQQWQAIYRDIRTLAAPVATR